MSCAKKCDRCGKYYDYCYDDIVYGFSLLSYDRKTDKHRNEVEFDICPDCVESFNEWFIKKDYIK